MRRLLVPVAIFVLVAAACGGGERESALTAEQTASPTAGATASPAARVAAPGARATARPAAGATQGGTTAGGATQARAAAPRVVSGGYQPPKPGTYTYRLDGEATNPLNPASGPQKFSNETLTKKISHSGNVITTEQTTSTSAGRTIQRVRWESNRVLLLSVKAETPQGDYSCEFDPPLLITRFPVRPGTIPTQQFRGSGNACNGKLDITIERQEAAKDATGRSWDAWRVRVKTQSNAGQFSQNSDDTRWVSPTLAVEVRSQGTFELTIQGGGGSQTSKGKQQSVLKTYPR